MFGLFSMLNGSNSQGNREVGSKSNYYYATGEPDTKAVERFVLLDAVMGEVSIDRSYLDYLISEEAVVYEGMMEDGFGRQMYQYYLK